MGRKKTQDDRSGATARGRLHGGAGHDRADSPVDSSEHFAFVMKEGQFWVHLRVRFFRQSCNLLFAKHDGRELHSTLRRNFTNWLQRFAHCFCLFFEPVF